MLHVSGWISKGEGTKTLVLFVNSLITSEKGHKKTDNDLVQSIAATGRIENTPISPSL